MPRHLSRHFGREAAPVRGMTGESRPPNVQPGLPEVLAALRKKASLTQFRLAQALGIDAGTVSRWERGLNVPTLAVEDELITLYEKGPKEKGPVFGRFEDGPLKGYTSTAEGLHELIAEARAS